ncbi:MAG: HDIG domain-containing protein [Bacteroidales bacterium]|nr:HDIG domain-containing protein [Bacteroidales bacterium]
MLRKFYIKNRTKILRFFIISLSFIIIFLAFPNERKFRYEFQRGTPWQHDDLFAPFGFSIYKLQDELQLEIDSINNNVLLYFNQDLIASENNVTKFSEDFESEWANLLKEDSIKRKNDPSYKYKPYPNKNSYKVYFQNITTSLEFIYQTGTYDPSEVISYTEEKEYKLVFLKDDNLVKTYSRDNIFTLKTAYEYVYNNFMNSVENSKDKDQIVAFFKKIGFERYISKNLNFNKEKTIEIKKLAIDNLSRTRGFMQAGELIVGKGEIITTDKYRILQSLKTNYEQASDKNSLLLIRLGSGVVIFLVLLILLLYLKNNHKDIYDNLNAILLIFIMILIFVGLSALIVRFSLFNIYIFPLALLPFILKIFFDERVALFVLIIVISIIGFIVPNGFEFVVIQFVAGFSAIFGLSKLNRRGQLYISAASVFIAMSLMYFGIAIIQEGIISEINWIDFLYFGLSGLLLLSAYPLIYAFERIFGFISDITLLELSTTNHPLLQKLSSTAPGTFQHSLQVSNLAEAAANKIGANSMLVRVGALYHDIGKTTAPAFFIENQVTGYNPHDQIAFDQSAQVIISHVTQGIALASKHNLPQQIIDFIRTHHGTTTVQYFYKNYIKKFPDKIDEIETFTYPGPKPFSKETAILMMADSIEAASRSLKEYSVTTISDLIENIIDYQMKAKQFEDANITFKDITEIKELFKELILNVYHARIEYPK